MLDIAHLFVYSITLLYACLTLLIYNLHAYFQLNAAMGMQNNILLDNECAE